MSTTYRPLIGYRCPDSVRAKVKCLNTDCPFNHQLPDSKLKKVPFFLCHNYLYNRPCKSSMKSGIVCCTEGLHPPLSVVYNYESLIRFVFNTLINFSTSENINESGSSTSILATVQQTSGVGQFVPSGASPASSLASTDQPGGDSLNANASNSPILEAIQPNNAASPRDSFSSSDQPFCDSINACGFNSSSDGRSLNTPTFELPTEMVTETKRMACTCTEKEGRLSVYFENCHHLACALCFLPWRKENLSLRCNDFSCKEESTRVLIWPSSVLSVPEKRKILKLLT